MSEPRESAGRASRFAGRNVIVTGASSGIGRESAVAFAEEGAPVFAGGRDKGRLAETRQAALAAATLTGATGSALQAEQPPTPAGSAAPDGGVAPDGGAAVDSVVLDLRDDEAIRRTVARIAADVGHIHVLVNCAGIAPQTGVLEIPPEQWRDVLETNLSAPFFMSQAVARVMVEPGGGVIVNISSANAFVVESPYADYNAAKAGLNQLTTSMAFELGHLRVRDVSLAPGMTMTTMMEFTNDQATWRNYMSLIPMRRPATPREQADVVLFLASDEASYVTGVTVRADGGIMHGFWADPREAPPVPRPGEAPPVPGRQQATPAPEAPNDGGPD